MPALRKRKRKKGKKPQPIYEVLAYGGIKPQRYIVSWQAYRGHSECYATTFWDAIPLNTWSRFKGGFFAVRVTLYKSNKVICDKYRII